MLVPGLPPILAILKTASTNTGLLRWLRQLGGPGLILLGLLDNSVVPVPGSMDVLTVILSADQRDWWPYYAFMATVGSVIGGFFTYRLGATGKGKIEKRFKRVQVEKFHAVIEKWGFFAIAVPALMPPPLPMVPFLLAAGATKYSLKKFIPALFLGRALRYSILGLLAAHYGRPIFGYFARHTQAIVWTAVGIVAIGIGLAVLRARHSSARAA